MTADWKQQPERGSVLGIRILLRLVRGAGRPLARLLLRPVVAYYLLTSAAARQVSRDYLRRVLLRPVRLADIFRHFLAFAETMLDRLIMYQADGRGLRVESEGLDVFTPLVARGQGALLVVAHTGSFDVMRLATRQRNDGMRVRVLMNVKQGAAFLAVLRETNPALLDDIIDTSMDGVSRAFQVQQALAAGHMVAVMADRLNDPREAALTVNFLGGTVRWPALPWNLAGLLGVPVVACTALAEGHGRYRLRFRSMWTGGTAIPRRERAAFAQARAQEWSAVLAQDLREYPYNWFNFFPYFDQPPASHVRADADDATAS